jgi:hypothetical protein
MFLLLDDICASSHATTEKVDKSYLHVIVKYLFKIIQKSFFRVLEIK